MLSVLIVTRNSEKLLANTFSALVPVVVEGLLRRVVVVDQGSTDETRLVADGAGCTLYNGDELTEARCLTNGVAVDFAARGDIGRWLGRSCASPHWRKSASGQIYFAARGAFGIAWQTLCTPAIFEFWFAREAQCIQIFPNNGV